MNTLPSCTTSTEGAGDEPIGFAALSTVFSSMSAIKSQIFPVICDYLIAEPI